MTAAAAVAAFAPHRPSPFRGSLEPPAPVVPLRPAAGGAGLPPDDDPHPDPVELAGLESFPASDPPAWTGVALG